MLCSVAAIVICGQTYQKASYVHTHTVSSLTFNHHFTDTTIDQQFTCILLPNI